MVKPFVRVVCLLGVVMFAGASRAGESSVPVTLPSAVRIAMPESHDGDGGWSETAQMVLFGVALSYAGVRLAKRKA